MFHDTIEVDGRKDIAFSFLIVGCVQFRGVQEFITNFLSITYPLQRNCIVCFDASFQQTREQQRQITTLKNEVDTVRKDNVKLYEKIKFLQSYPNKVRPGYFPFAEHLINICCLMFATIFPAVFLEICCMFMRLARNFKTTLSDKMV